MSRDRPTVVFVTDPMCSWCWGMAADLRQMHAATEMFDFDLLLGGINATATQPVTAFARARLAPIWRTVNEVTGARFGRGLPDGEFVYNSTRACVAVEAVRAMLGRPPFDYLYRLQKRFFVDGVDVTGAQLLRSEAVALGIDGSAFDAALASPQILARVRDGFALAKSFGTAALPSVLLDVGGVRRLVAGGYVDAPTLRAMLEQVVVRQAAAGPSR